MDDRNKSGVLLKALFIVLFLISLILNFALSRNLSKQDLTIDHLFKYKKAYIKLIGVLGASEEESEAFLEK